MAEVETTREGAVLTITLNRPDVLNAFNTEMQKAFAAALKEARDLNDTFTANRCDWMWWNNRLGRTVEPGCARLSGIRIKTPD